VNNQGKICGHQIQVTKRQPRIIKTANSKPADNKGRLYLKTASLTVFFLVFTLKTGQKVPICWTIIFLTGQMDFLLDIYKLFTGQNGKI